MRGRLPGLAGFLALWLGLGCSGHEEPEGRLGAEPGNVLPVESAPTSSDEVRVFGTAPDASIPLTRLAEIVQEPERFHGRVVRTEGQIARVCQRMGCWMELREGEEGPAVRVPMAGHSFFLPRDSAGRHATMQGRVAIRELTPDERAHLESEGAQATASPLSIEATGVAFD